MLHCKITLVNAPKPAKLLLMGDAVLTISSKNYSSWSLRGWLLCRMAGLDFKEELLSSDDPEARAELLMLAPSYLVPRLTHNGMKVWDTLAIAEYLHENFPQAGLLPLDPSARSHCRSVCGEMHLGFANLRSALPMNIKAHYNGFKIWAAAQADIERVTTIWRECLAKYGGPYLFGETPTVADAMYAPVATRFATYDVKLDRQCADYCETILALPDMLEWTEAARTERAGIEELEAEF
jgi:glutathione S-transferase